MHQGSDSAFHSFTAYYAYANRELQLLRSVIYDWNKNKSEPWFQSFVSEMDASTALPITESEAQAIMDLYSGVQIEMTPFP